MATIQELLQNNTTVQALQADAALARKRSEASKKAAATVKYNKYLNALRPKVRTLFTPAPVTKLK